MSVRKCSVDVNQKDVVELQDFIKFNTLGTGTFGRVFLVRHKTNLKYYAMKVLRKSHVVKLKQVQHIYNEKEILLRLDSPYIVKLHYFFQDKKNLYLIFEFVMGGELFTHLRAHGRFSRKVTRFYIAEVVLAFEYLHARNIVFRDLKPENLLLDSFGHIKLTDFGFAKILEDNRTFTMCGTPEYLAPEVIKGKGHGVEVDWWSVGCLTYELLAGYPPFYDDEPFGIYEKILLNKLSFPSHFSRSSRDFIKKLLVHDRTKRLGNLKDGVEDIKRHKFFKRIDWENLAQKKVTPPVVPLVGNEGDTSNFEVYDEEDGYDYCFDENVEDPFASKFADF